MGPRRLLHTCCVVSNIFRHLSPSPLLLFHPLLSFPFLFRPSATICLLFLFTSLASLPTFSLFFCHRTTTTTICLWLTEVSHKQIVVVVVRWQKNNEKVGKEAREVKRKSKQIVAEGLKRNGKDRRGWKRRRGEGDR